MTIHEIHDPRDLPEHRALFVVDMKDYSKVGSKNMPRLREDFDDMLATAFAESDLSTEWQEPEYRSDTGDGVILGLPTRRMWRLVDPLVKNLDDILARYDRERFAATPAIRVRMSVHMGPLPDSYRGDPINDLCRLVSSTAAHGAIDRAAEHGSYVALLVSDEVFQNVVRGQRTKRLAEWDFHPVKAEVPGKSFSATAWAHVPQVSPTSLAGIDKAPPIEQAPKPSGASQPLPRSGETLAGRSPQEEHTSAQPTAAPKFQFNNSSVGTVAEQIGTIHQRNNFPRS